MKQLFFLDITPIANDNYVAFTFFVGTMAMMAASVFFFFERIPPMKYVFSETRG